jgi:hypothetical protein
MNLTREAAGDRQSEKKKERKGTEVINAQSSLAIVTGLSQLTMAELRKGKESRTREDERGKKRERV